MTRSNSSSDQFVRIIDIFKEKHAIDPKATFIEFFKFGLYPEFTNQGWGSGFFVGVLESLFKQYDIVYFDTRDHNHAGVLNFYKDLKIDAFYAETLPSDFVDVWKEGEEPEKYVEKAHFVALEHYNPN